jgi:hypothetical protein
MGCFRDFLGGSIQAFSFSFCFLQARYVLSLHIRIPFIAHPWLNTLLPCGIGIDTKALLDIATILAFRVLENCAINPSFGCFFFVPCSGRRLGFLSGTFACCSVQSIIASNFKFSS